MQQSRTFDECVFFNTIENYEEGPKFIELLFSESAALLLSKIRLISRSPATYSTLRWYFGW